MDCEFVGVGKEASEHMLARVSIVTWTVKFFMTNMLLHKKESWITELM
jgi:hypothetical protein